MARARTLVGLDVTARRANKPESPPPEPIEARRKVGHRRLGVDKGRDISGVVPKHVVHPAPPGRLGGAYTTNPRRTG